MIPAGQFNGAPGAGLGNVQTLWMPADATGVPFNHPQPAIPTAVRQTTLGGLGAAQAADSPLYAVATLAGAGLGGALIGWVAADSAEGAQKGAAFAAGLTGVSTGMATWPSQKLLGALLVVGGLSGMLWSVRSKIRRHR